MCPRIALLAKLRDAKVCLLARAAAGRDAVRKVRDAIVIVLLCIEGGLLKL